MEPFIPASFNLALNWTADLLFPVLLRAVQNINEVVITDEENFTPFSSKHLLMRGNAIRFSFKLLIFGIE
jgi:hypothetical protein